MASRHPQPGELADRVAVVTGATSGLGRETTRALARAGATVVMATRNSELTQQVMDHLRAETPWVRLDHVRLDLADLASVRACAQELVTRHPRISLLVNNAGVMNTPLRYTADGFELQFGVNHLGHFALTAGLVKAMAGAHDPRVVTISSLAARAGRIRWEDPHFRQGRYNSWVAYAQSKLANQMFAVELHRRLRAARMSIASMAAHPGYTATNLSTKGHSLRGGVLATVGSALFRAADKVAGQDVQAGVQPQLFAATAPVAASGRYYGPAGLGGTRGRPTEVPLVAAAKSEADGARLWDLSVRQTGASWPFDETGHPPSQTRVA